MTLLPRYQWMRPVRPRTVWRNRYLRLVSIILIITAVASFYIYQRVWVRNLVAEIDRMRNRNERAMQQVAALKTDWTTATALSNVELTVQTMGLGLRPTRPSQNFIISTIVKEKDVEEGRYAGLVKALGKLKGNFPTVTTNEADAKELFQTR